jgi:FKBP-type peptidyl-prolyl cis-trans isomerase FkpA
MKIYAVFFISIFLFLASCNQHKDYKKIGDGIFMKLISLGECGQTISPGDFVVAEIEYSTTTDSVFFKRRVRFQIDTAAQLLIDKCIMALQPGDSASFLLPAEVFFQSDLGRNKPKFLSEKFKLNIYISDYQSKAHYIEQKEQFIAWASDFKSYEQTFLKQYVEKQTVPSEQLPSGMYKIVIENGHGPNAQKGDTVSVKYAGKFLNGKFFDSSAENMRHFQFILGTEWQVISGLEEAILSMSEKEKAVFIMPSELAFGSRGSSTGIIPPYTSVIFEVSMPMLRPGPENTQIKNIL